MRPFPRLVSVGLLSLVSAAAAAPGQAAEDPASHSGPPLVAPGSLRLDRGESALPLWVPPEETLDFLVEISVGPIRGANVGTVELSTGVEAYRSGLPLPGQRIEDEGRTGWLRSQAKGGHLGYEVEHEYLSRHLPSAWPRVVFRDTQKGSENRRRELKIGLRDGDTTTVYRRDSHCEWCERREHFVGGAFPWQGEQHCQGCKRGEHRVWVDPETRTLPAESVDMLSAVYLARSLLLEGREQVTFPLVDKTRLWSVTLERGERKVVRTPAGRFDAYKVVLSVQLPEGEPETDSQFEGLFGIRGNIDIWVHATTGVPVAIGGEVPVGPLRLDVSVSLRDFEGTPPAFGPVK